MRAAVVAIAASFVGLTLACAPASAQELSGLGATHIYGPAVGDVARLPTDAEVMAAWPAAAKARGLEGSAVMRCVADMAGVLSGCQVMLERSHAGFGQALLSLAPLYRLRYAPEGKREPQSPVMISATWPAPQTPVDWQVPPKPGDFATAATPGAWRSGGKGLAVMNCLAARLGALHDCEVIYQEPASKGFGAMALRFQGFLRLKPATVDGKPTPSGLDVIFAFRPFAPGETF